MENENEKRTQEKGMSEAAKEARREYNRAWIAKNRERRKEYIRAYWERKAMKLEGSAKGGE